MIRWVLSYLEPNMLAQYNPQQTISKDKIDDVRSFCSRGNSYKEMLLANGTTVGAASQMQQDIYADGVQTADNRNVTKNRRLQFNDTEAEALERE